MLNLLKKHWDFCLFGFVITLSVGLGQTFFIAQFIPEIQKDLGISRSEVSFVYSLATFIASFNLSYIGGLLDRIKPLRYFFLVSTLLALGLGTLSLSTNLVFLFIGFYLLRGFGQVPLGLLINTTVTKYYGKNRGKLLTLVGLGRSCSEGILPISLITLIGYFGWRGSLGIFAGIFLVLTIPLALYFIPRFPTTPVYEENTLSAKKSDKMKNWSWKEVFSSKWPIFIMLNNALIPFILTGLFFQQASIAEFKGWTMRDMALSYSAFSIIHICGSFIWGPLIDKFTAKNIQPFVLIPLLFGLIVLMNTEATFGAYIYMALVGLSIGISSMVRNTFWAEVFGTENLGQIKGKDSNVLVIGTSIAPILYAWLLDQGMGVDQLLKLLIALTVMGIYNYSVILVKFTKKL